METEIKKEKTIIHKTLLEKYNCTQYYYQTQECAKKISDSSTHCDDLIRKMGECIYNAMLQEDKKQKI